MREQGWYVDPYGLHSGRWYSDGIPTSLVRDNGIESRDAPPRGELSASPAPLTLPPSYASDLMRADESWVSFFSEEPDSTEQKPAMKPWWLATTSASRGLVTAGWQFVAGVAWLISSFLHPADGNMKVVVAVVSLAVGAWFAASAVVARSRLRKS